MSPIYWDTGRVDSAGAGGSCPVPPWDGGAYAANTAHHRAHDAWFLADLPVRPTDRVLDLGCGAGDFTRKLAELVPSGHVVGLDAQDSMIGQARRRAAPHQSFVVAPVQALGEVLASADHTGAYDVVTSRSVLHWVPEADWPGVLAEVRRLLRPGGFLRIECGGAGNIRHVVATLDRLAAPHGGPASPWTFLDAGTVFDLTERAGFVAGAGGYVRTVAQRRAFSRESLAGWLHSQCIEAYRFGMDAAAAGAFTAQVDAALDELARPDGAFDQTYVRLDLLLHKPRPKLTV